jgi:hypothetical protein
MTHGRMPVGGERASDAAHVGDRLLVEDAVAVRVLVQLGDGVTDGVGVAVGEPLPGKGGNVGNTGNEGLRYRRFGGGGLCRRTHAKHNWKYQD